MKKYTLVLLLVAISLASCTKSGFTPSAHTTCFCSWSYLGKDSTAEFNFPNATQDQATDSCNYRDTWVKSFVGKGVGSCRLL